MSPRSSSSAAYHLHHLWTPSWRFQSWQPCVVVPGRSVFSAGVSSPPGHSVCSRHSTQSLRWTSSGQGVKVLLLHLPCIHLPWKACLSVHNHVFTRASGFVVAWFVCVGCEGNEVKVTSFENSKIIHSVTLASERGGQHDRPRRLARRVRRRPITNQLGGATAIYSCHASLCQTSIESITTSTTSPSHSSSDGRAIGFSLWRRCRGELLGLLRRAMTPFFFGTDRKSVV